MEDNKFENSFKEAFDNMPFELNNDEIWENIEPHLKKKKKRRFIFFWLLLGGLALYALMGNLMGDKSVETNTIAKVVDKINMNIVELGEEDCPEYAVISEGQIVENKAIIPKRTEIKHSFKINNAKPNKATLIYQSNVYEPTLDKEVVEQNVEVVGINPSIDQGKLIAEPNKVIDSKVNVSTVIENDTETKTKSIESIKEKIESKEPKAKKKVKTTNKKATKKNRKKSKKDKAKAKKKKKKAQKKKKRKKKRQKNWEAYVQVTGAAILPLKSYGESSCATGSQTSLISQLKERETQKEAFAVDLNGVFVHKNGLTLVGGIGTARYNEIYEYQETEVITTIEEGIISVIEDGQGNILSTVTGPKTIITTTETNYSLNSSHTFVNANIGVGATWQKRRNPNVWQVVGGVNFNLYHGFNGYASVIDANVLLKNKNKFNHYFSDIGLWLSGSYIYKQNKRLQWVVSPKIQIPLSTYSQNECSVKEKFTAISLNLGINYLLNPKKPKKKKRK